jgi:hypothetical protein
MAGASGAYSRDVFEIFGCLDPQHASSEDVALAIRGVLLESLVYVDEPTVCWRQVGLWSGMTGDSSFDKKIYFDGMIKTEAIARQALMDALTLRNPVVIRYMCKWWVEAEFRRNSVLKNVFHLPIGFLIALRNGGRFLNLLRWAYHAVWYRIKYNSLLVVARKKEIYAPLVDREIIYQRNNESR